VRRRRIEENSCRSRINIDCFIDGTTDRIVPSVFHRELGNNYGLVPQFPTASPTEITDGITDGNHTFRSARLSEALLPTELSVAQFPTVISDRITDG
jgi:hypothetical protein